MDRSIVYAGTIPLDTDILLPQQNTMVALGYLMQALYSTNTVFVGLPCNPTAPASMTVNVAAGAIITQSVIEQTQYGSLVADTTDPLIKMGINIASTPFTLIAPTTSGQSQAYLIQASFSEGDDNPATLTYFNSLNPQQSFSGPNNSGTPQNTRRSQRVSLQLKAGTPATTGSQTTPPVDSGWFGLYVITVSYGQTSVSAASIAIYPGAPFLSAFLHSHHTGLPGNAPKIDLTSEVSGILPIANLPPTVQTGQLPAVRTIATSNVTMYVSSAGNDSTGSGTSTAPFLTIQKAMDTLAGNYDFAWKWTATIQLANGTYSGFTVRPLVGAVSVNVTGSVGTPANVVIQGTNAPAIDVPSGAWLNIAGCTIQATGTPSPYNSAGHGIVCEGGVCVQTGTMSFGACGGSMMVAENCGRYSTEGNPVTITGNAQNALLTATCGTLSITDSSITVQNNPTFTAFASVFGSGFLNAQTVVFTGSASGSRYSVQLNGVIATNGGGASYFPGSTAGTTATGGQYS